MYEIKDYYLIKECEKCGLVFINPQPSPKKIGKYYPAEEYYSLTSTNFNLKSILQKTYYSKENNLLKFFLLPFKPFLNSVFIRENGRFLDIGCGSGQVLELIKNRDMLCYGVEPGRFNKKIAAEKKLNIFHGDLIKARYPSNYFDVITMNHVIEHVYNPLEVLIEIRRIIKPNGIVIIGTPVSDSLAFRIFKKNWIALDTPRHLFIFSKNNLKEYAKKAGFSIQKRRYNSTPLQFIGSLLYLTNSFRKNQVSFDKFMQKKYFVSFLYVLFTPLAHIFNLLKIGDQVELFLKPGEVENED
jgi:SAM-dependent methyltransferase